MVSSKPELRESRKSRLRRDHAGEVGPISVQIAGADPAMLAEAARYNVDQGARDHRHQHGLSGEEGLQRERRARRCSRTSRWSRASSKRWCAAVDVPVTLKIRTGPDARAAATRCASRASPRPPASSSLAIHGRTRACAFTGDAEYDTIAEVKSRVRIPVDRQRRHPHARGREARARAHGRRRHHDRPRRAGPAVAVPRDRALSSQPARACRRRMRARSARCSSSTSHGLYASLRRRARRARRAQAHRLDGARAARTAKRSAAR